MMGAVRHVKRFGMMRGAKVGALINKIEEETNVAQSAALKTLYQKTQGGR